MFTALLDTCVLFPSTQRDFLLSLAAAGLYRPVWSSVTLLELETCEQEKLRDAGLPGEEVRRRVDRLLTQMHDSFGDDAEIRGFEALEGTFDLPDSDDEHVAAAAVFGGAGVIVTNNLKHFPGDKLPPAIRAIPPAEFVFNTVAVNPFRAWAAIDNMVSRRRKPPQSADELLDIFAQRYGMSDAVDLLRREHPSPHS